MAAEGLPAAGGPGWELEAWYQDLQEVLAAAEPLDGPCPSWWAEQAELAPPRGTEEGTSGGPEGASGGPECYELDAALAAELLELLGPESSDITEPPGAESTACGGSSYPTLSPGQEEEEEEEAEAAAAAGRGRKRKRRSGAGRELAKRREQANEQRVLELRAHNEQLREEIARLSGEVERTRAALIQRILSLRPD